jgi:hypothetical protein
MTTKSDHRRRRADPRPIRVLFGCTAWPCGLLEVASWAKQQRLAEPIIQQIHEDSDGELDTAFVQRLVDFRPHVVGFRVEGDTFEQVQRWIPVVRRHSNAEIVLGGPSATSHPVEVLEQSGADYVFAGEAEKPFNQFLRFAWQRDSKDRQPDIPGLAYRYGEKTHFNTLPQDGYGRTVMETDRLVCSTSLRCLRHRVRPVAESEILAAGRLDWSIFQNFEKEFESLYFTGGRGCPGSCTFCARMHGNEVRKKSAEQLFEEIEAADRAVADGTMRVGRWKLFQHVDDPTLCDREVAWASVFDEDFFIDQQRAMEFFRLWEGSSLKERYRLSVQTNPCSLLIRGGVHLDLMDWIHRLKPMIMLGGESFHQDLLQRWHKRHNVGQLERVLDALDRTRQDYTVFQILTDFDTTPEELVENLRLLILAGYRHRRMRIASSPFMIPLFDSDIRRSLDFSDRLPWAQIRSFRDFERPHPEWMDPLVAELADLADAELQFALEPEHREGALGQTFEAVRARISQSNDLPGGLEEQAEEARREIQAARFQEVCS